MDVHVHHRRIPRPRPRLQQIRFQGPYGRIRVRITPVEVVRAVLWRGPATGECRWAWDGCVYEFEQVEFESRAVDVTFEGGATKLFVSELVGIV
jgi:hypothetical protein